MFKYMFNLRIVYILGLNNLQDLKKNVYINIYLSLIVFLF